MDQDVSCVLLIKGNACPRVVTWLIRSLVDDGRLSPRVTFIIKLLFITLDHIIRL